MTDTQGKEYWNVATVAALYTSVETWVLDLIRGHWEITEGRIKLGAEYKFTFADNEIKAEQVIGNEGFALTVERENNHAAPVYPGVSRLMIERPIIAVDGETFSNDNRGTGGSLDVLMNDYRSVDELLFTPEHGAVLTATLVECRVRNESRQ